MNVDIDPKTMYTYKAYSHHIQNTLANMADLPELTKISFKKQKSVPVIDQFIEGWRKTLKEMFLLPLTEDEINKIKEKTKNKQETPQDVEEIIKRK